MFNDAPELVNQIAWAGGTVFGVLVMGWLLGMMGIAYESAKKRVQPNPIIHAILQGLEGQVDDPDDPIIQRAMGLPLLVQARKAGLITAEQLSELVSGAIQEGIRLTDGIPDVEFTVKGKG